MKHSLIINNCKILRFLINFCNQNEARFFNKAPYVNYLNPTVLKVKMMYWKRNITQNRLLIN